MKDLYFPNIVVKEDAWLKYSLLYRKELYTIKPTQYANLNYSYINGRVGQQFLKAYNPEDHLRNDDTQGVNFEDMLIRCMLQINTNKEQFKVPNSGILLDDSLRLSQKNSVLFKGKFTDEIERFVIAYGYGEKGRDNIKVSNRFAIIYMGLLAEHIAHLDPSVSLVSKPMNVRKYLNNSHILSRSAFPIKHYKSQMSEERYKNNFISHIIPRNINELTIEEISGIRTNSYLKELDRFNILMDKLDGREFVIGDSSDIYKEIQSVKGALDDMLCSKFGKETIALSANVVLMKMNVPFLMTEALTLGLKVMLDKYDASDALGFRNRIAALKIMTTIGSIK